MKKLINLNVNGIRSAVSKGLISFLESENPDFITFQEVKINEDSFFLNNDFFRQFFLTSNYAEKKGYSGVVTLIKEKVLFSQTYFDIDLFNQEGRVVLNEMDKFYLINVYFPSGTMGETRQKIKDEFLVIFNDWVKKQNFNKPYLIVGDFNIAHQEIDIHNPKGLSKTSGFLPHERKWFTEFLNDKHIDLFRNLYPNSIEYSWYSYRANAKNNNKGWRIDYAICNQSFCNFVTDIKIEKNFYFSDHLPIICLLNF